MALEDPHWRRFALLFRGLERAHGIYELLQRKSIGKKVQGKARTVRFPVTDELWEGHFTGAQGLGIVPINDAAQSWFGAIDVDRYDLKLNEVEAACAKLGLPLLPTRTKSGGVHLYMFAREALPATLVKQKLEEWAVALGYGGAEVFPKQSELLNDKDVGNWINMPYFNAASGLTDRYGVLKGKRLEIDEFCDRAEELRVTAGQLASIELAPSEDFIEGPPCLQSLSIKGFGEGSRNHGLFAVGVYLKKRYPDDWKAHIDGYNSRYFKPPLGEAEIKDIKKSLTRKDYSYRCNEQPCKAFCNQNVCRTREFGVGKGLGDWGIVIDSDVQMVKTDPPYWILSVNTIRMQFFAEELMRQSAFQKKCMETLRVWPGTLTLDKWRGVVNKVLTDAEEVEAPPESGIAGELAYHLAQFCDPEAHPAGETREELITGKPFAEDGIVMFRAADFKRYLEAQHFRGLAGARLTAVLKTLGLTHKQVWLPKNRNINVWAMPAAPATTTEVPTREMDKGAM